MFIQLTRTDGAPIWLNSVFIVTVEPFRGGGSVVVPIGDGLDYEVRESPETVLAMLDGAPPVKVVPVPPPKALTPRPDDVSPDVNVETAIEPVSAARKKPQKKVKEFHEPDVKDAEAAKSAEPAPAKKRKRASPVKKNSTETPLPEDFTKIVNDLKARKCRSLKRVRNAIKSYYGKTEPVELDRIIDAMAKGGYIAVEADGHINWIG